MRLDFGRPHRKLGSMVDPDYMLQDGKIFCWSESNTGYEHCWWLTDAGDPISDSEHVKNLLRDRPFDKAWLA